MSFDNTTDTTTIDEGQTDSVIGNFISTDPDTGNTFTYSLFTGDGDTDNSLFNIVDNQLIANTVFDFETQTSYSIRVKTTDQDGLSFEKQLNINVNDINEVPTDLSYDTTTIDEGQTTAGNLTTTDPDTGNTFTYSLVTGDGATDNSLFTITNNQLKTNSVFDFESKNSYSIRVKTTDQDGLSFEKQLTIGVSNVNETPADLTLSNSTVAENQVIGTVVGNLTTTDPDTGNTFTYSLVTGDGATDNSLFTITNNQLKTNSVFDFESKNSYSIRVKTTDQDGLSFEKQLTIGVSNVNEAPILNSTNNDSVFVLKGDNNNGKERLEVKLTGYNSKLNSELGVFIVDDASGTIDGIAPGAAGYTDKALQRGQVIFSLLANPPVGFNQSSLSRLLELDSNNNLANLRFYLIKDGSTDSYRSENVLFGNASTLRSTPSGNGFSLAWEDGSGNATGFEDLRVTINPTDTFITRGTSLQNKRQGESLDLRGITGAVKADFVVNREAAYNNFVGFYKVTDENGGIDTNGDGRADILPGQAGYAQAAVSGRVSDLALAVNNNGTANFNNKTLQGGSIFVPFIITDGGTPDNYKNIYFTFLGANSDGVDHVRLLGDNTFGFEDLAGGGDNDFNDVIVKVNLTV